MSPDNSITSTDSPRTAAETSVTALRIVVAAVLIIHGVARTALGIVDDFGGFLGSVGFPAGTAIAWAITAIEVFGGLAMAAGRWVRTARAVLRGAARGRHHPRARIRRVVCRRRRTQRRRVQRRADCSTVGGCICVGTR